MNKKYFKSEYALYGALAGLILCSALFQFAQAIYVSAPFIPTLPNDITGLEIRDGTITDADITATSTISANRIGGLATGSIPFMGGERMNGTTSELFYDPVRNFLAIGSTSPTQGASTTGAMIMGTTTTGNLVATSGVISLGNQTYISPTSAGTSNQALVTDGANVLSWATAGDWLELATASTTAASSSVSVSLNRSAQDIHVIFEAESLSASQTDQIIFNNDTGTNYGYQIAADFGAGAGAASATRWVVTTTAHTGAVYLQAFIGNNHDVRKYGTSYALEPGTGAAAPSTQMSTGVWNNATTQINVITVQSSGGGTYPAGTRLTVYGKKN